MELFLDEETRRDEVRVNLAEAFNVAEAALSFWLAHDKDRYLGQSKLPESCLFVSVGLDIQCCRLFRSVIEECGRCEAFTANILTRSLYESVLGLAFVLLRRDGKPKLTPKGATMYCAKIPHKSAVKDPKHWLSRELRGLLHIAHSYFHKEVIAPERMGKIPGLKREIKRVGSGEDVPQ